MAAKTVVLHFGAHKTGTSLIQKFMRDKEGFCLKSGIRALPRSDGDQMIGWGRPADIEAGRAKLQAEMAEFEADTNKYFVISHENALGRPFRKNSPHLYPDAQQHVEQLREVMGDRDYRVVYFIRNQAAFIESYYLQTIHEGAYHTFRAWLGNMGDHGFSWKPLHDAFCANFGSENVTFLSFDAKIADGQDAFLRSFFESFTTTTSDYEYKAFRNPSIGDRGLQLALQINAHLKPKGGERKLFRKFFQQHFSNRHFPRPVLFSDSEKAELNESYAAENSALTQS